MLFKTYKRQIKQQQTLPCIFLNNTVILSLWSVHSITYLLEGCLIFVCPKDWFKTLAHLVVSTSCVYRLFRWETAEQTGI